MDSQVPQSQRLRKARSSKALVLQVRQPASALPSCPSPAAPPFKCLGETVHGKPPQRQIRSDDEAFCFHSSTYFD
ncbi:hypothetical protein JMJ77_0005530, partial [Colletotrichum scovillei]